MCITYDVSFSLCIQLGPFRHSQAPFPYSFLGSLRGLGLLCVLGRRALLVRRLRPPEAVPRDTPMSVVYACPWLSRTDETHPCATLTLLLSILSSSACFVGNTTAPRMQTANRDTTLSPSVCPLPCITEPSHFRLALSICCGMLDPDIFSSSPMQRTARATSRCGVPRTATLPARSSKSRTNVALSRIGIHNPRLNPALDTPLPFTPPPVP